MSNRYGGVSILVWWKCWDYIKVMVEQHWVYWIIHFKMVKMVNYVYFTLKRKKKKKNLPSFWFTCWFSFCPMKPNWNLICLPWGHLLHVFPSYIYKHHRCPVSVLSTLTTLQLLIFEVPHPGYIPLFPLLSRGDGATGVYCCCAVWSADVMGIIGCFGLGRRRPGSQPQSWLLLTVQPSNSHSASLGFSFFIYKMRDKRTSKVFPLKLSIPLPCSGLYFSWWHPRVNFRSASMLYYQFPVRWESTKVLYLSH